MTSKRYFFFPLLQNAYLFLFSEERASSTHALTMYRHNTIHNGQEIKVGKFY
jgi:hypothetical protein